MQIEVKYPVGYKFWVPRVYEHRSKETIQHPDAAGILQKYSREVITLLPMAKHKVVELIEITITESVKIRYWCKNVDDDDMARIEPECDMAITSQEIAMDFATRWRDQQQQPYYGSALE
jgi:hypothetical protein